MAKSRQFQSSFASGELSPLLKGRTDLEQYYRGCETAEEVMLIPQGGLKKRGGLNYYMDVAPNVEQWRVAAPTMTNGGTPANVYNIASDTETTGNINTSTVYEIAKYYMGVARYAQYADIYDIKLTEGSPDTAYVSLQYSYNGINWYTQTTFSISTTPKSFRFRFNPTNPKWDGIYYPYYRIAVSNPTGIDYGTADVKLSFFGIMGGRNVVSGASIADTHTALKTIPFPVDEQNNFIVILNEDNADVWRAGNPFLGQAFAKTPQYSFSIPMPYDKAHIPDIRAVSYENVLLLFHEDYAPRRLILDNATIVNPHPEWVLDEIPFSNVPQVDYNDTSSPTPVSSEQVVTLSGTWVEGNTFQIEIDGVTSKSIGWGGNVNDDNRALSVENVRRNLQDMPIFGSTGVSVSVDESTGKTFTITLAGESAFPYRLFSAYALEGDASAVATVTITAAGTSRKEDLWSSTRGYPKMGEFHGGRLWLGGTKSKPQSIIASKAGLYFDYDITQGADDEAIFVTMQTREIDSISDIKSDRDRLQIFTRGGEHVVTGNTPSSISVAQQTAHGSMSTQVSGADGATLFLDANEKTVRQFVYKYNEDAHVANDLTTLSSHLISDPQSLHVLTGTGTEDANWVFVNCGTYLAVLNTLRSQDINGWTKCALPEGADSVSYSIADMCVINNMLFVLTRITGGGRGGMATLSHLEFDCKVDYEFNRDISTNYPTTVLGFFPFVSQTVSMFVDGVYKRDVAISSTGGVTLITEDTTYPFNGNISIGKRITPKVKTMPLNTEIAKHSGGNLMREKRINRMNIRVADSAGVYIDGVEAGILEDGNEAAGVLTTATAKSGIVMDQSGGKGWGISINPEITAPDHTDFHIQAIEYEVESS
ncbi:MAG: hypothetical protein NZ730_06700 [Porticoccaceae bacterium]|nr:hypothetical protein [Porticoccaceae bacterium]